MIRTSAMKELRHSLLIMLGKSVLPCRKAELPSSFFFLSGFLSPLYHFHPLHRHLHISKVMAAESSPLRIAGSWTQSRNLWFAIVKWLSTKLRALYICPFHMALMADVVKSMLETQVTLGNISLVLLNLIKIFIFVMFNLLTPMFTQLLTFIFSL